MSADPAQLRWHAWAAGKGKPLLITESGVAQGFTDAQRAAYFLANETWLRANGYRMLLFWNGAGTPPSGQNWDFYGGRRAWPKTVAAVSAIACRGRADGRL
jgi:hypothetical protein